MKLVSPPADPTASSSSPGDVSYRGGKSPGTYLPQIVICRRRQRIHVFQTRSVVRLAEEERKNLDHSIELLSGTYDLVTELEALYDFMPQRCQFPEDTNKNDATLAGRVNAHLIFMCRREFTLGTLTLLRGYLGDHRYHLRKAIESCAFAVKMTDSPHFARLWIRVGAGDDAFQKFRDKFKKLFPANDPLPAILGKHYDICAKATHRHVRGSVVFWCLP